MSFRFGKVERFQAPRYHPPTSGRPVGWADIYQERLPSKAVFEVNALRSVAAFDIAVYGQLLMQNIELAEDAWDRIRFQLEAADNPMVCVASIATACLK